MVARCQRSWSSTSATETLNRAFRRSVTRRRTWRLDFSEPESEICRVRRATPTNMAAPPLGVEGRPTSEEAGPGLLDLEGLDHVKVLEVGEAFHTDTALEALLHLAHVVLEPLQARHLASAHLLALTEDAHLRAAAHDTIEDRHAGDGPQPRDVEGVAHLGPAELLLGPDGLEQASHGRLHPVDELVDDRVGVDAHALGLG